MTNHNNNIFNNSSFTSHWRPDARGGIFIQNDITYVAFLLASYRQRNTPCEGHLLTRRILKERHGNYSETTLDDYYVSFINDVLRQIRAGKTDYVFHEYHIGELLRFEPALNVAYSDGAFVVWLPKEVRKPKRK